MEITKDILKEEFSKLGIKPGMNIIVHSSLKSFGKVDGGADSVIDALCELLTEEGTLVMPSFNHGEPYRNGEICDISETPTSNGIIPETFRKRPDVIRSINPTHSFAVWGKNKERYTKDHQQSGCFGVDSPLYRLMEDGGYCLLLGVGYDSNTFHHCVETCEGAKCVPAFYEAYPMRIESGEIITATRFAWRDGECPITDKATYGEFMKPIEKRTVIGNSDIILYKLSEAYPIIAECLKIGTGDGKCCSNCDIGPRQCKWTIKKD